MLQANTISFDIHLEEIFPALVAGASLEIVQTEEVLDVHSFQRNSRATIIELPTAVWHAFSSAAKAQGAGLPDTVHTIIVGGEPLAIPSLRYWADDRASGLTFINSYGISEATAESLRCEIGLHGDLSASGNIGRPISNTQVYVLDEEMAVVPTGLRGELYIGGAGVARGYIDRPALTAAKFVPDPFREGGGRLYRTGDIVSYSPSGELNFIGRKDNQLKIRGFRVEPGEIERVITSQPTVEAAVAVPRAVGDSVSLVAYVVAKQDTTLDLDLLRRELRTQLPEYMVPSVIVCIDELPLTPNGKIDRARLPNPQVASQIPESRSELPRTATEQTIADIWCETLGLRQVGRNDKFFEIGGTSLSALTIASRLSSALSVPVTISDVLRASSVSALASRVANSQRPQFATVARVDRSHLS